MRNLVFAFLLSATAVGCGRFGFDPIRQGDAGPADGGGVDGGSTVDAGIDAGTDAGADTGIDAGTDAGGPGGVQFTTLIASSQHSCGIAGDNDSFCWGWDSRGQLGENADGNNSDELVPSEMDTSALTSGTWFTTISTGGFHGCGITNDNRTFCWGSDQDGQVGDTDDGDNFDENIPVAVDVSALNPGTYFVSVSVGGSHSCGLANDNVAYCWGRDNNGQLGNDAAMVSQDAPVAVSTATLNPDTYFTSIDAGILQACGIANDNVAYCWGNDQNGRLGENGDGDNNPEPLPVPVDTSNLNPGRYFVRIDTNGSHSCGLSNDNLLYCWGWDVNGQLGEDADGDNNDEPIPVPIDTTAFQPGAFVTSFAVGGQHTCVITNDDRAYCWGSDASGQLGEDADGDNSSENTAVALDTSNLNSGTYFVSLSAGGSHSCGLANDGVAYCWGSNVQGRLGIGNENSQNIPVPVDVSLLQ